MALSVGRGLGKAVDALPLEAIRDWAEYFSGTVQKALDGKMVWADDDSRRSAKLVAWKLGKKAKKLVDTALTSKTRVDKAVAVEARRGIEDDRACPGGGAGKWCEP